MRQQASASVAMSLTPDLETLAGQSEVAMLESWMSHEPRCQAQRVHDPSSHLPDIVPCSTTVEYRLANCTGSALSCRNAAERGMRHMSLPGRVCGSCKRPASECWKIIPI